MKGRLYRNFCSHKIGNFFVDLFFMHLFQLHLSFLFTMKGEINMICFWIKSFWLNFLIGHIFRGEHIIWFWIICILIFFIVQRGRQNNISFQYCQKEDNNMHFEYSFDDFDDMWLWWVLDDFEIWWWFMSSIAKFVFEVMLVVRGRFCRNFYSNNMGNKFPTLILFLFIFFMMKGEKNTCFQIFKKICYFYLCQLSFSFWWWGGEKSMYLNH